MYPETAKFYFIVPAGKKEEDRVIFFLSSDSFRLLGFLRSVFFPQVLKRELKDNDDIFALKAAFLQEMWRKPKIECSDTCFDGIPTDFEPPIQLSRLTSPTISSLLRSAASSEEKKRFLQRLSTHEQCDLAYFLGINPETFDSDKELI